MKIRLEPPDGCWQAGSNGSRRLTAPGTVAGPATPAVPVDSSSGSLCRPSRSSERWKTSTWHRTPSRATARRVSWSGPTARPRARSRFPASLNYLALRLRAGESWRYQPAIDHTVGWVAVSTGRLRVPETVEAGELAIFEPSNRRDRFPCGCRNGARPWLGGSACPRPRARIALGAYQRRDAAGRRTAAQRDPRPVAERRPTLILREDKESAPVKGSAVSSIAEPEEITRLVLFVASDEASFSTGSEFIADGGSLLGPVPDAN